MEEAKPELQEMLQNLYIAFFPKVSKFELPPNTKNRYLYFDEWEAAQGRVSEAKQKQWFASLAFGLGVFTLLCLWTSRKPQQRIGDTAPAPAADVKND
jgi:hypothetical protein